MTKVKHTFKDGIFRRLFNDETKLVELYNALSGSNYPPDTHIKIVTLENAIFGDLKNDLAFIIAGKLIILVEAQSTINPNMPLRSLVYLSKEYEKLYFTKAIYGKKLVKIPTPELYVFYNGKDETPLEQELKLSDAFYEKYDKLSIEAVVKVINVNYEKGAQLLKDCQTLAQYSQFIFIVRQKCKDTNDLEAAIKEAIKECIRKDILKDFLKENGGDVVSFLYETLTKEEMEQIREEDGYARGKTDGLAEGEAAFAELSKKLLESNRLEDLRKALNDTDLRSELYKEFNIK